MKRDRCRRDAQNHSESMKCCAFLGTDLAAFHKAMLACKCVFDRKRCLCLEKDYF